MNETFRFWTRRIIAWVFTLATASVLGYLAFTGVAEARAELAIITGMIIAFYFGTRTTK